jgi:hypothetical protein
MNFGLLSPFDWNDPEKMNPNRFPLGLLSPQPDVPAQGATPAGPAPAPVGSPMQLPSANGGPAAPQPQNKPGILDMLGSIYGQGGPGDGLINLGLAVASPGNMAQNVQKGLQTHAITQMARSKQAQEQFKFAREQAGLQGNMETLRKAYPGYSDAQLMGLAQDPAAVRQIIDQGKPTYGVIGKDELGRETYGWINPKAQTTTPVAGPTPGQPLMAPGPDGQPIPIPANADPAVFRKGATERALGAALGPTDEATGKLRGEVQNLPSYKNLAQAAPIYQNMNRTAGTNSRASDLNLVYSLGKIFDPGSVVREGEMVMVRNTASIPDWLAGTINSLNGGQALTPETRAAILKEAHDRITSYQQQFEQDAGFYRGIAGRQRMNTEDIIPNFGEFKPWTPAPTAPPTTPGNVPVRVRTPDEARRLPSGTRIILPDGSEGRVP